MKMIAFEVARYIGRSRLGLQFPEASHVPRQSTRNFRGRPNLPTTCWMVSVTHGRFVDSGPFARWKTPYAAHFDGVPTDTLCEGARSSVPTMLSSRRGVGRT